MSSSETASGAFRFLSGAPCRILNGPHWPQTNGLPSETDRIELLSFRCSVPLTELDHFFSGWIAHRIFKNGKKGRFQPTRLPPRQKRTPLSADRVHNEASREGAGQGHLSLHQAESNQRLEERPPMEVREPPGGELYSTAVHRQPVPGRGKEVRHADIRYGRVIRAPEGEAFTAMQRGEIWEASTAVRYGHKLYCIENAPLKCEVHLRGSLSISVMRVAQFLSWFRGIGPSSNSSSLLANKP